MSDVFYDTLTKIRTKINDIQFQTLADAYCEKIQIINKLEFEKTNSSKIDKIDAIKNILGELNYHIDNPEQNIVRILCQITEKFSPRICNCSDGELCISFSNEILKSCKNFEKFIEVNPIINLLFEDIPVVSTKNYIMYPNNSFNSILSNLKNLRKLLEIYQANFIMSLVINSAIYDFLMRNLFVAKIYQKQTQADIINIIIQKKNPLASAFFDKYGFNTDIWINNLKISIEISLDNKKLKGKIKNTKKYIEDANHIKKGDISKLLDNIQVLQ